MKAIFVCLLAVYLIESACGVPLKSKEEVEAVETGPCNIEEFKNIPVCDAKDETCRQKRQTMCEANPGCDFCGTLIEDDAESDINVNVADVVEASFEDEEEAEAPARLIERNIIIENDNDTQYYRGYVETAANITTVIRLVNHINNTNIINMPTTLNNTNINNIHIFQNTSSNEGGKFGVGFDETGSCCYAAKPKTCKQSTAGPKCHYRKQRVCGRQCTKKIIYPNRNQCSYTPQWPYVRCPQNQQFSPGYYQQQQFYPPQQYYPQYPQYPPQYPPQYAPQQPPIDMDLEDYDDEPVFPEDSELQDPESGWIMVVEKCKIVSENGLTITNCTDNGKDFDHPFARNSESESIKRSVRQSGAPMMYPPPMPMMYPPMYQPIPLMYMPQYQSPYYAPPPQMFNAYQSQQIPMPPFDELDADQNEEVHAFKKPRKHAKKHHPVVMEDDEEL